MDLITWLKNKQKYSDNISIKKGDKQVNMQQQQLCGDKRKQNTQTTIS